MHVYFYNQVLHVNIYAIVANIENNMIYFSLGVYLTNNHHFEHYDDITSCHVVRAILYFVTVKCCS